MDPADYLKHYASAFGITEINSTFYRIPTQSMAKKWHSDTPEDFIFTAKVPRLVTHEGRLRPGPHLDQFLASIRPLGQKMRVLVIQLPPSLPFQEAKPQLEKMVSHLPLTYRYAVEGRHPSWFGDDSNKFLSEKNLCLVWNEVEGVSNPAPVTTDFVYLRLIGDRSIPEKEFGKIQKDRAALIQKWVEKINQTADNVQLAIIMANNHFEGFAASTANKILTSLGMPEVTWKDKRQRTLSDFEEN